MKTLITFTFLFILPFCGFGQNYTFNNGLWGYENVECYKNEIRLTEIPSEFYLDTHMQIASICIFDEIVGESVSQSFHLLDVSYNSPSNETWTTYENYLIEIESYLDSKGTLHIFFVKIYFDGKQIGELNYPITN